MSKKNNPLYDEFYSIQGKDPIYISSVLADRIEKRLYADSTMKAIVGLLREFVENYESASEGRNKRYAVGFGFSPWHNMSSPVLFISDAIEEKAVAALVWNRGKITTVYAENKFEELEIKSCCEKSIARIRDDLSLRNNQLWGCLDRNNIIKCIPSDRKDILEKYDLRWDQIDPYGELSPIKGLNAVVQDQLAAYLGVPITWLRKKKTSFVENGIVNINHLGIILADASDVCAEVHIEPDKWGGVDLPLENEDVIHITKSQKLYFSAFAAAWMINRIKQDPEYAKVRKERRKYYDE